MSIHKTKSGLEHNSFCKQFTLKNDSVGGTTMNQLKCFTDR